ncbi:hypothetical protein JM79_1828 [Gramella sp. Hel_I_59]|uniref:hypothetical protein n=1 Tax=Gramella sp. Hel_I_59 TaxID=1249978 RepID=UPI001154BF05|nr:hypothetical protein [Gramella sp. Hel_I_59]TQI70903.1 hypothetical protein JM79_1828 [Gramella sp. Hel_I_59]
MANILDLFKISSGKELIQNTRKELNLDEDLVLQIFASLLPWSISKVDHSTSSKSDAKFSDLKFADLLSESSIISAEDKKLINSFLENAFKIEANNSVKFTIIAENITVSIISEIQSINGKLELTEIKRTLLGASKKASEEFVKVITSGANDSADLIKPAGRIALEDKDSSEDSILGGFTGGK